MITITITISQEDCLSLHYIDSSLDNIKKKFNDSELKK